VEEIGTGGGKEGEEQKIRRGKVGRKKKRDKSRGREKKVEQEMANIKISTE
jgi:hypothetical protein